MKARPVLLTGFEPFAGMPRNPSADVVRALAADRTLRRLPLVTALLPVHRHGAPRVLRALVAAHLPRAILMTGVAVGRPAPSFEMRAVNRYRGLFRGAVARPVVPGGPKVLRATLPFEATRRAVRRAGQPLRRSMSAGTYCCNLVLYLALRDAMSAQDAGREAPSSIGFLHLPATPESVPGGSAPTLPLLDLVAAVRAAVASL